MIETNRIVIVATLLALAACSPDQISEENAPMLKLSGEIIAEDGSAPAGCKLAMYDTAGNKSVHVWDVEPQFDFEFQSKALMRKFYFRAECKGHRMVAHSKVYSMDDLSRGDFAIDLGRIRVGEGAVTVTGRIAAQDGARPKACSLGLYTGFHREPVKSWRVSGEFSETFHIEDVDNHFHFQVSCEGYDKPYKSVQRSESWLAESGGRVELGVTMVR